VLIPRFTVGGKTSGETSSLRDGRRWFRLEAWDIAANGAFTQPV
jgi:hypothetical protein